MSVTCGLTIPNHQLLKKETTKMATMNFESLLAQIDSVTAKKKSYDDGSENFWRLTKDKAGNASAVIRFLPNKETTDIPFVRIYTHSFKDPTTNRWYIENSLSTIGEQDYIADMNRELWNSGLEENKKIVSARARKLNYISNILVVKDQENPESEGKVFKFKYGKKIFDKIIAAAKPDEDLGEEPVNVFEPEEGADFLLRMTIVANFPNYDSSKFSSKKPIAGGKKRIEEVLSQRYDLAEEIAPSKFKTKEELKSKFLWVTGQDAKPASQSSYDAELDELTKIAEEPALAVKPKTVETKKPPIVVSDDDDDSAFFQSLIDE